LRGLCRLLQAVESRQTARGYRQCRTGPVIGQAVPCGKFNDLQLWRKDRATSAMDRIAASSAATNTARPPYAPPPAPDRPAPKAGCRATDPPASGGACAKNAGDISHV
jgi:hypothetical protein